jgi:hypothetical protein
MRYIHLALCLAPVAACASRDDRDDQPSGQNQSPVEGAIDAGVEPGIDAAGTVLCTDVVDCEGSEPADYHVVEGDPPEDPPHGLPTNMEIPCDGIDQDGDGADLCIPDPDGDTYTWPADCDESDAAIHPGVLETWCDGIDQNCNGYDECDQDHDGVLDHDDCNSEDPAIGLCEPDGEPEPIP